MRGRQRRPTPEVPGDDAESARAVRVLHLAASKWTLGVLEAIDTGTNRFNALHGAVEGISHRLLSTTLRRLIAEGAVERYEHEGRILHVEYHLTAAGDDLLQTIHGFCGWVSRNPSQAGRAEHRAPTSACRAEPLTPLLGNPQRPSVGGSHRVLHARYSCGERPRSGSGAIREGFGLSAAELAVVVHAYLVTLPRSAAARWSSRRRAGPLRVFLTGMGAYLAASAFCALAVSGPMLITGRVGQEIAAAVVVPSALALHKSPAERTRAMGIWAVVAGSAVSSASSSVNGCPRSPPRS